MNVTLADSPTTPPPDGAPGHDPQRARRSRLRRLRHALAVSAVALGLLAGAAVLHRTVSAETLALSGLHVWGDEPGDTTGISDVRNALGTETFVDFVRGGNFEAQMGLVNRSSRAVRITAIPRDESHYYRIEDVTVAVSDDEFGEYGPFRPFRLGAGDTRWIRVRFRFADCVLHNDGEARMFRTALRVDYRVVGFPRSEVAPFEREVLSVPGGACDRPFVGSRLG